MPSAFKAMNLGILSAIIVCFLLHHAAVVSVVSLTTGKQVEQNKMIHVSDRNEARTVSTQAQDRSASMFGLTKRVTPLLDSNVATIIEGLHLTRENQMRTLLLHGAGGTVPLDPASEYRLTQIEHFRQASRQAVSIIRYTGLHEDKGLVNYMYTNHREFYLVSPEHGLLMHARPRFRGFDLLTVSMEAAQALYGYLEIARAHNIHF